MNFQNNVFLVFATLGMTANAIDILRCAISILSLTTNPIILTLINLLYYLVINSLPITFFMYCLALVRYFNILNRIPRRVFFVLIPVVLSTALIIATPFIKFQEYKVFYIVEGTSLIMNGSIGYLLLYIEAFCFLISGFHLIWIYRKYLEKGVLGHMLLSANLMIASLVAQFMYPYARVLPVALSMFMLDLSFYIQRSEHVYDTSAECLNKEGFIRYLDHLFIRHFRFHIFSIVMDDSSFYLKALGEKDRINMESCIIGALKSNYKGRNFSVYKLSFGSYALIAKGEGKYNTEQILEFIKNQIGLRWGFSALELSLSFSVCQIESQLDVNSCLETLDIINYHRTNKKLSGQIVKASSLELLKIHSKSYLENAIYKGLKNNRFEVYYQPIYSVKNECLTGAEALIRLRDDDGNFVSPEEFIPIAEQNGTIFEIGKFVFTEVCKELSQINRNEYNIGKIDINLSVIQCIQEDMHKQLIAIRNQYNIPSSLINMEITETASTNSPEVLLKNMRHLEADGIDLSLDDYGSGNSNISYILTLPFKMIKIDKGIVWKAFENREADIVLKSTIDMIKSLGLKVLAEGVETEEQSKHLKEIGCDYLQGYFYSRPLPAQQFLEVMKK